MKSNAPSELVSVKGWQDCIASLLRKPLQESETFEELTDHGVEVSAISVMHDKKITPKP